MLDETKNVFLLKDIIGKSEVGKYKSTLNIDNDTSLDSILNNFCKQFFEETHEDNCLILTAQDSIPLAAKFVIDANLIMIPQLGKQKGVSDDPILTGRKLSDMLRRNHSLQLGLYMNQIINELQYREIFNNFGPQDSHLELETQYTNVESLLENVCLFLCCFLNLLDSQFKKYRPTAFIFLYDSFTNRKSLQFIQGKINSALIYNTLERNGNNED